MKTQVSVADATFAVGQQVMFDKSRFTIDGVHVVPHPEGARIEYSIISENKKRVTIALEHEIELCA